MAQFLKCTALFTVGTTRPDGTPGRIGGWSESFYNNLLGQSGIREFEKLCQARAGLLPRHGAIVGQRYQIVNEKGGSSTGAARFSGRVSEEPDMPQMALLLRIGTGSGENIRPVYLRGMPDSMIFSGEYAPTAGFTTALNTYLSELNGWYFKGRDLTLPSAGISTIAEDGTFVLTGALAFDVNSIVQIRRTNLPFGRQAGAIAYVQTKTDSTHGKLYQANWPYGITKGGTIRIFHDQFFALSSATARIRGSVVKKVGRPFDQFRGRQSARR